MLKTIGAISTIVTSAFALDFSLTQNLTKIECSIDENNITYNITNLDKYAFFDLFQ